MVKVLMKKNWEKRNEGVNEWELKIIIQQRLQGITSLNR